MMMSRVKTRDIFNAYTETIQKQHRNTNENKLEIKMLNELERCGIMSLDMERR